MSKRLYPFSEEHFQKHIQPHIQNLKDGRGRRAKIQDYSFFCGALYVLRTGVPWRDLPDCYGPWHTIYTRFKRWSDSGWFWKLLQALQESKLLRANFTWVDSTTISIHRHGSGALKKRGLN